MFRVLFLKNGSPNSDESFIDSKEYVEMTEEVAKAVVKDAAEYIVKCYNRRTNDKEFWTAEIVQVISKVERTGGSENGRKT